MNKFLLIIILLLAIIFVSNAKINKKVYFDAQNQERTQNKEVITKINNKTKNINRIHSDISIKLNPMLSVKGFIAYEKSNNFRMICNSFFGKEIEIGSNDDYFWFWSRTLRPKSLYYGDLEQIEKTRLRKIFYPVLLRIFLGIDEIKDCEITQDQNKFYIIEKIDLGDEKLIQIKIIENDKIISQKITNLNHELILDINILEFQENSLPKKLKLHWLEENIQQEWILENTKINNIGYDDWEMPNSKSKIDLINY